MQVPLCGDCHTQLHAHALAITSFAKGNKKPPRNPWWPTQKQELNAEVLCKTIVDAALTVELGDSKIITTSIEMDSETSRLIKLLKQDIEASSIPKAIMFAIHETCARRGLFRDEKQHNKKRKDTQQTTRKMWGMRGTKKRTDLR